MDLQLIHELINSLKMIIEDNKNIKIPNSGEQDRIELKSNNYMFFVDLNRGGHKKPKCTFQLREQQNSDSPLLRLDLIGRTHPNPPGDYPYANEEIPCPHLHIAHPEYGSSIAFPLNTTYANMYLSDEDIENLVIVLTKFLERCNVGNISEYDFNMQNSIFD